MVGRASARYDPIHGSADPPTADARVEPGPGGGRAFKEYVMGKGNKVRKKEVKKPKKEKKLADAAKAAAKK
jgi:hypothetical protein